ncbi:MAG: polysaccharide pyruvyl transferase family protein [Brevundimonas sp.]|jgi:hypothetical protein
MTRPEQIFLFNSSLPSGPGVESFLSSMGPATDSIRGRNIGNSYISYGFLTALFGKPVHVDHVSAGWDTELSDQLAGEINERYSHLVFVLQDAIRADFAHLPFERFADFLEKIQIPVVPISLGANSFDGFDRELVNKLGAEQKRFLHVLAERSRLIGVRGSYTAEVLSRLGLPNVVVTGCPSYFANGAERNVEKRPWDPDRVITTATFFNRHLPRTAHLLQDELYFIHRLFLGEPPPASHASPTARPYNLYEIRTSMHLLMKALMGRLEFFSDLNRWAAFFRSNDHCLTIGTRLHSAIFSINCGVPAIVTNPDSRARESCEFLRIPYDPAVDAQSDIEALYGQLDLTEMNAAYPALHGGFVRYLTAHGLKPTPAPDTAPEIVFPDYPKRHDPSVLQDLYSAYSEVVARIEEEMIALEFFGGKRAVRARDQFRRLGNRNPSRSMLRYLSELSGGRTDGAV